MYTNNRFKTRHCHNFMKNVREHIFQIYTNINSFHSVVVNRGIILNVNSNSNNNTCSNNNNNNINYYYYLLGIKIKIFHFHLLTS